MGQHLYPTEFDLVQTEAENNVARFQRRYGFPNSPPVPVEMIAKAFFGLRCEFRKLGRWGKCTTGALSKDDSVIYVDERCNRHQYIFAVAHEIGHWVLHEDNHCCQVHFDDDHSIPLSGVLGSTQAKKKKEKAKLHRIEANRFAGALLVPRSFLFSEAEKYKAIDAEAIGELARLFDVSIQVMLYRIKNLSKYLAWSGPRIDWDSLHHLESLLAKRWQSENQTTHGSGNQRISKLRSVGKSEAAEALDPLVQFASRRSPAGLLSQQVQGSTKVGRRRPCEDNFLAHSTGREKKRLAKVIGDYLRKLRQNQIVKRGDKRPFIVELAGTPNAGKDRQTDIISDYLQDVHCYKVRIIDEAIKACCIDKDLIIERLYKTVALAVVRLYEARFENPGDYDFVIFNRGLFDELAFVHAAHMHGRISREQELIHINYLLSYTHLSDIVFLFLISPEESIQREIEPRRSFVDELFSELDERREEDKLREQRILNREMLAQLNSSYLHMYRTYKETFNNQIYLFDFTDGGDAGMLEKARALADAILPRHSAQLPFPELFGVYYARRNPSGTRNPVRRQCLSKPSAQLATQLSFFWE